jgi:gallate 1-beta-glucosyltransferase
LSSSEKESRGSRETESASTTSMGEEPVRITPAPPHLLLICFPGQGHVNPMLRLAKRIAAKGLLVTFSSTCDAGDRMVASAGVTAGGEGVAVGRGRLRFEFMDDGFHGKDLGELMMHLDTTGRLEFARLLRRQAEEGRPVTCAVVNPFMPWAVDVAAEEGIPSAVLWVQSCLVFSLYHHHVHGLVEFPGEDDLDARLALPGLQQPLSVADVPSFLLPSNPFKPLADTIITQFRTIDRASWVLVNSFSELEPDVVAALPGVTPRPPELIPVGPLVEGDGSEDEVRGDLMKAADECVGWLDAQAPRSVVYASVGSVVVLSADEVAEMAHGLAATGRQFLWVVRPDARAMLPDGFLDAVGGRGTVVPWSPQDRVLAHPGTACFLTHCGWNSTLETIAAGVPVVAFPQWGDQCTDALFLADVLRMGVRLPAPARRGAVRDAVEAVVAGPGAEKMRDNARRWGEASRAAVAPGGSSDKHVQSFVDEVRRRACGQQEAAAAKMA